jgi:hypothetical protein
MPPKRTPPKKTRDPRDDEDIRAAMEAARQRQRQPDPPAGGSRDEEEQEEGELGEQDQPTAMERRLVSMFKDMMREQDSRNALRVTAMETLLRTEIAAVVNRDEVRIVSDEPEGGAGPAGGAMAAAATGPLLKVPATTMPPPKLS